ncbi:MAG: restriction endonuclease subunit S [Nitrosomonas sp.]|uniref:restriction endonuclease subunit S n=1 Tax=Nitrosomonas sp. TaxID=42353 RepID=UPI0025CD275B|nr:restriction endonuclease subunit S [Nitrosomonas sp.]MBY0473548.1 restriction endonuclease subunit S [Nitrosomonas sp.]
MSAIPSILTEQLDIWTSAATEKKSGRGRSGGNGSSVYGIQKLRALILELAVRGQLVPQDPNDEPASELFKRIQAEKARLISEGKIKKDKPLPPISDEEKPFELPQGWVWGKLGDLCRLENGDRSKNYPNKSVLVEKGIPFVNAGHLEDGRINRYEMTYITQERYDLLRSGKFFNGDILYCLRGSLGKSAIVEGFDTGAIASSLVIIRIYPYLSHHYFVDYFDSPLSYQMIKKYDNGTAQPNLSATDLEKFLIPLPSLSEQHRIVAKVDELMALCDQLESQHNNAAEAHEKLVNHLLGTLTQSHSADDFSVNWQRIATHFESLFTTEASIDALKQTLLQLAVMGKLVPQDPNDEPASELLKRIQAEKTRLVAEGEIKKNKPLPPITDEEKPFELPQGWRWVRLGNVLIKITDGTHHSPPNIQKEAFKYISAKNIKSSGIDLSEITYVTKTVHNEIYGRCDPVLGDILYIKDGATTGIATINTLDEPFSMLSSVALLKPSVGTNNQFLLKTITSPLFYAEMRAEMTGVAITRVTLAKLNNALIPLPPLAEQYRIVTKVDELMALCDQLKSTITQARQLQKKLADVIVEQAVSS